MKPTELELYDQYARRIYSFVYYKVMHKETAEDLTSQIFLKAIEHYSNYEASKGAVSTWLFSIARNAVTDHYRRYKIEASIEDAWDIGFDERLPEKTDALMKNERLRTAMQKLSAKEREILTLRFWKGLSFREISEITGQKESAIKMSCGRSIKKLKADATFVAISGLFITFIS